MAENSFPKISFAGASQWSPYEGGSMNPLLPFEGFVKGKITKATPGKAKSSDNHVINFEIVCQDEDCAGKVLTRSQPYTGQTRGQKPRPNVHGLFEACISAGIPIEKIQSLDGQEMDVEVLCNELVAQDAVYIEVRARQSQRGDIWLSDVANFIKPQRYHDSKAIGAHRTSLPPDALAHLNRGTVGGAATGAVSGNGASTTTAQPAAATTATGRAASLL